MIKSLATHTYTAITASKFYTPYFWQPLVSGSLVPKDQVMISNFYLFSFALIYVQKCYTAFENQAIAQNVFPSKFLDYSQLSVC